MAGYVQSGNGLFPSADTFCICDTYDRFIGGEEKNIERYCMADIALLPLEQRDREQFIKDNQEAFNYGALEEFGRRDDHFEEDGVVIRVDGERGDLDLLFVSPKVHSKGIGYAAWCAVEKLHPEVVVWETVTPYFEKRINVANT